MATSHTVSNTIVSASGRNAYGTLKPRLIGPTSSPNSWSTALRAVLSGWCGRLTAIG